MVFFFRRPVKGGREDKTCGVGPRTPQAWAWRRGAGGRQQAGWAWGIAREGEGEGVWGGGDGGTWQSVIITSSKTQVSMFNCQRTSCANKGNWPRSSPTSRRSYLTLSMPK